MKKLDFHSPLVVKSEREAGSLVGCRVWIYFLIGQNKSSNQKSGMILEVQIQNFSTHTSVKVFIFKKYQGAQILIFLCENWHEASFYIKERMQENKFDILSFKNYYFGPPKKRVFAF